MKKLLNKRVLALVMTLAMVFSIGNFSFADEANPANDTNAYYYQTDDADIYVQTGSITVYVTIESGKASRFDSSHISERSIPVTLNLPEGKTNARFCVTDVLYALQEEDAYADYGLSFLDSSGNLLEKTDTYFYKVKQNGKTYGPNALSAFDGWMVRINNRFAIDSYMESVGGLSGETIKTMYLKNGDDIHLYMDDTTSSKSCVPFIRLVPLYSNGQLAITVEESHNYFGSTSPYPWTITDFAAYSGANGETLKVYNSSGTEVTVSGNAISGNTATLDVSSLNAGTYTVVLDAKRTTGLMSSTKLTHTMAYTTFIK